MLIPSWFPEMVHVNRAPDVDVKSTVTTGGPVTTTVYAHGALASTEVSRMPSGQALKNTEPARPTRLVSYTHEDDGGVVGGAVGGAVVGAIVGGAVGATVGGRVTGGVAGAAAVVRGLVGVERPPVVFGPAAGAPVSSGGGGSTVVAGMSTPASVTVVVVAGAAVVELVGTVINGTDAAVDSAVGAADLSDPVSPR